MKEEPPLIDGSCKTVTQRSWEGASKKSDDLIVVEKQFDGFCVGGYRPGNGLLCGYRPGSGL